MRETISRRPVLWGLVLIVLSFALDQAGKWYVLTDLMNPPRVIPVTSFFSYVLAWNTGVSFSLFNSYGVTGTYVLIGLSSIISLIFFVWLLKARNYWLASGLGLIIGGAAGNLADRVRFGAVVDFLHFYYGSFSWPAFNLADTFITIGVILIVIESFKGEKNA
ncbi:MAG: signal peptidase II [Alphaproteobacteria bacterium]|nr:signal peptidase II [Alphaproteobacteria bacterium]NCQ67447.1 signal peptidase II [Alphaproteobacteria bacterium]NCT08066.1 signal peptidase II [Alphaproteobacteria bacterium]